MNPRIHLLRQTIGDYFLDSVLPSLPEILRSTENFVNLHCKTGRGWWQLPIHKFIYIYEKRFRT